MYIRKVKIFILGSSDLYRLMWHDDDDEWRNFYLYFYDIQVSAAANIAAFSRHLVQYDAAAGYTSACHPTPIVPEWFWTSSSGSAVWVAVEANPCGKVPVVPSYTAS